jgi:hypothetical protein
MSHVTHANDGVTHEQLAAALAKADKSRLIATIRAVTTRRLWDFPEEELRDILSSMAHSPESSHAEVFEGLQHGA